MDGPVSNDLTPAGEPDDRLDLDLATTALLARDEDLPMLMKLLADQLATSLPERLKVEREGGLFRKSDRVRSIEVDMGADTYLAEMTKGRTTWRIGHTSGGIRIRTEDVATDEWIRRLLTALKAEAGRSQGARRALENIVFGGLA